MQVKVLIISDNPNFDTGMGIVHRYIGQGLHNNGYHVISLGCGPYEKSSKVFWKVYSTRNSDYYGKQIFTQLVANERPDIVLTIGDPWNFDFVAFSEARKYYQWVAYTAIDGIAHNGMIPPTWNSILLDADRIVAYTEYGRDVLSKSLNIDSHRIEIIPHGVDTNIFYKFSNNEKAETRKRFGIAENSIIYLLMARNQLRKNIPEIFKAWSSFKSNNQHSLSLLWPHMLFRDPFGNNLDELIDILNLRHSLVYLEEFAHAESNIDTVDTKIINQIYNIADVVLLLSGEGFGLPFVEAMACGKPVIALNHSAGKELIGDIGELVDVDYYITGMHATERPYPDLNDLVSKMSKLYYDKELREKYGKLSLVKSNLFSWQQVNECWSRYLRNVIDPFSAYCQLEIIS